MSDDQEDRHLDLAVTLEHLKYEYDYIFSLDQGSLANMLCPPKYSFTTESFENETPSKYTNCLVCQLSSGYIANKLIYLNERTKKVISNTFILDPFNERMYTLNSEVLTWARCGLMTALALEKCFYVVPDTIGFIGAGRISYYTGYILRELFGVKTFVYKTRDFSSESSKRFKSDLEGVGAKVIQDTSDDFGLVRACDALVTATNSVARESVLEYDQISGPQVFISHDSGYILGESVRQYTYRYSDHPAQLKKNFDVEFPFDSGPCKFESLCRIDKAKLPISIYLYGIAIADAVIALEILKLRGEL